MTRPLDGIRVLDATHVLAGPYCGYLLAQMGADVIRLENPSGVDLARSSDPDPARRAAKMGVGFLAQNANKRSIVLDLKSPEGQQGFRRISARCDVIVENFRPGKMSALGLGPWAMTADRPELVYCSISGFGQSGPFRDRPAYDHIVQGMSGLMSITGTEESGPVRAGFPIIDYLAGLSAASAICAALVQRERTGKGEIIDAAMLDAALAIMGPAVGAWAITGREPVRMGNKPYSGSPFSGYYATADGAIVVVANTLEQARAMATTCGLADVLADPRVEDWQSHPELADELSTLFEAVFRQRSALEWEALLNARNVPCAKVRDIPEIMSEPHVSARGALQKVHVPSLGEDILVPGPGVIFGGATDTVTSPPPAFGEHSREILLEAGYTDAEVARLLETGIALQAD